MADAPERIYLPYPLRHLGSGWLASKEVQDKRQPAYVRADLYEQLQAEVERLNVENERVIREVILLRAAEDVLERKNEWLKESLWSLAYEDFSEVEGLQKYAAFTLENSDD